MSWFSSLLTCPYHEEMFETLCLVRTLNHKLEAIMATLNDILVSVEAEDAVDDSIIALLQGIKEQLDTVLAGGLTPAQQTKVDAIFEKVETSKKKVQDAVLANTPQDPA